MTDPIPADDTRLQALLLADHIYRDQDSGKYVVAGVFHQMNVNKFPSNFSRTIGIFASIYGLTGKAAIDIEFVDLLDEEVLMSTNAMEIFCENPNSPVEFAIEVPPLPLPHPGQYLFRLIANGTLLGSTALNVNPVKEQG